MFKNFIPPLFGRWRRPEPKFYLLSCPACGFRQDYEVAPGLHNVVCNDDESPQRLIVDELPRVCPNCGQKLTKKKIPVKIFY